MCSVKKTKESAVATFKKCFFRILSINYKKDLSEGILGKIDKNILANSRLAILAVVLVGSWVNPSKKQNLQQNLQTK